MFDICMEHVPDAPIIHSRDRMLDSTVVSLVTELGRPLDLIQLLQMSWEDRLKVCSQSSCYAPSRSDLFLIIVFAKVEYR